MKNAQPWLDYTSTLYSEKDLGFYLDLKDSGVSEEAINQLNSKMRSAIADMHELESGCIANPDENRQVGHYWLRNPELAPSENIQKEITETLSAIKAFSTKLAQGSISAPNGKPFSHVLLIGIGGSALGPQFIYDALGSQSKLKFHFLDNTDPAGIDRTLQLLLPRLSQTLVIVISKSGGTAETRNGMLETQHLFDRQKLTFSKQAVAITGAGSQLYNLAQSESWLSIFPMWDWVGGRTSVTSAVGVLPAALMGIDIDAFLRGARLMDDQTRAESIQENPAALLALTWYAVGNGSGQKDMVILPYKDQLSLFSKYLQQLIMESIGKKHDLHGKVVEQGIAVYGNKGSTDQHAYIQQLRDGLDNFFVTFIEVLSDRSSESILVDGQNTSGDYLFGFFKGTQTALRESNRSSLTLTISDLSPKSMGALIALYERAVGLYASLVNINAYHQPGVEAGKKAAGNVLETKNKVLKLLAESGEGFSIEDIAARIDQKGEEVLIYHILRHYAQNHPLEVEGTFFQPESLKVKLPK